MPLVHQPSNNTILGPAIDHLGNDDGLDELLNKKPQKLQKQVKRVLMKLLVMKGKVKLKRLIFLLRIPQMRTKF